MPTREELLQQEVRELTEILRDESSTELQALLASKGLRASETVLAGMIWGEDGSEFGALLTKSEQCIVFETAPDGSLIRWETVDDPGTLTYAFQAVSVGLSMMRSGQIS
jgi:hypothetical protein